MVSRHFRVRREEQSPAASCWASRGVTEFAATVAVNWRGIFPVRPERELPERELPYEPARILLLRADP
jgi:hypothetical protein